MVQSYKGIKGVKMRYFDCFAVAFLWALSVGITMTFFTAYLTGGEVLVQVNNYGEGLIEAIIIPIVMIMGTITLVRVLRR